MQLNSLYDIDSTLATQFNEYRLSHALWMGDTIELSHLIRTIYGTRDPSSIVDLDMVIGLNHLGRHKEAAYYLNEIQEPQMTPQRLKYLATSILTNAGNHNYENAYNQFLVYDSIREKMDKIRLTQQLQFSAQKHSLELVNQKQESQKILTMIISLTIIIVLLLIITVLILYQSGLREINKNRKIKIENYQLRIMQLESEANELNNTIKQTEFSKEIVSVIQQRIEMLNALVASAITNDKNLAQPYELWTKKMISDSKAFLKDTKLAFKVSHPNFIKFLENQGLTEQEIGHACLYAIGLRGNEIGQYLNTTDNYNISSRMRAKLGLKSSHSNLSQFLQRRFKQYK